MSDRTFPMGKWSVGSVCKIHSVEYPKYWSWRPSQIPGPQTQVSTRPDCGFRYKLFKSTSKTPVIQATVPRSLMPTRPSYDVWCSSERWVQVNPFRTTDTGIISVYEGSEKKRECLYCIRVSKNPHDVTRPNSFPIVFILFWYKRTGKVSKNK